MLTDVDLLYQFVLQTFMFGTSVLEIFSKFTTNVDAFHVTALRAEKNRILREAAAFQMDALC